MRSDQSTASFKPKGINYIKSSLIQFSFNITLPLMLTSDLANHKNANNLMHQWGLKPVPSAGKKRSTGAKRGKTFNSVKRGKTRVNQVTSHDWFWFLPQQRVCFGWVEQVSNHWIFTCFADEPERPKPPAVKIATNWKLEQLQLWQTTMISNHYASQAIASQMS